MKGRDIFRLMQFFAAGPRKGQPAEAVFRLSPSEKRTREARPAAGGQQSGNGNVRGKLPPPTPTAWPRSASHRPILAVDQQPFKPRPAVVLVVEAKLPSGPECATKENPWVNSLGMKFVSVPDTAVWFGIWDVRVRDYQKYAAANPGVDGSWENPQYNGLPVTPRPDCPVVNVSWNDAWAFCDWLTKKERGEGRLSETQSYRLPQEREWNRAVGNTKYPWGDAWPPPSGAGNYADLPLQSQAGGCSSIIESDDAAYSISTPVGSFEANGAGLYDMGGNVWQWCEDWYNSGEQYRVLRGASWGGHILGGLLSTHRLGGAPDRRFHKFGFRCVLADSILR